MDPEPESYLGSFVDKMPNCFLYFGPNCAPGAGNAYLCAETECELMIACVKKMLRDKLKSICIKYVQHIRRMLTHGADNVTDLSESNNTPLM
jgi:cation diffusion facilitator CzcD-associated flavoprotein CzcO